MCTVTWLRHNSGYEVFCNRDELKTRKQALPPRVVEDRGVRYLAPIDGESGGTWIAVNEYGCALCLINHYPAAATLPSAAHVAYRSRGLLLAELMHCTAPEHILRQLESTTMTQYRPFILLAFALHSPFRKFVWDETSLQTAALHEHDLPVTSSSFQTEAVIAARRDLFAASFAPAARHECAAFHGSHAPQRGAYSVCMHRPDAETVSFTHLLVRREQAELHYSAQAPCAGAAAQHFALPLVINESRSAMLNEHTQHSGRDARL